MAIYTAEQLDLSRLPALQFITIDFEAETKALRDGIAARYAARGIAYDANLAESDFGMIAAEEFAYRKTLALGAIRDAIKQQYIAYSFGAALDHLAATLYADIVVRRLPLVTEPRPYATNPEDWEPDERLQRRLILASEARAPRTPGAYTYAALTFSADVADAVTLNHASGLCRRGENLVIVLGKPGVDEPALCAAVAEAIRTRPLTVSSDTVIVRPARRVIVSVSGRATILRGPDPVVVKAEMLRQLALYGAERRKVARVLAEAGIKRALHAGIAESVFLATPAGDVAPGLDAVAEIGAVDLAVEVLGG